MKKWEYKIIEEVWYLTINQLNCLGEEGWELCDITTQPNRDGVKFYLFKREKK